MKTLRTALWIVVFCAASAAATVTYLGRPSAEASAGVQDVIQLDRRISQLEQKLYSIESRISSVEQQALLSQRSSPSQPASQPASPGNFEILLREVDLLRARLREIECGLVHIDERTLPASVKDAQKRAGSQSKDPCRLNPETPVRLSSRP